ncbi:MAG: hypothetical protein EXR93_07950 [Gemmatimonadetes bacterium]|nr:hypothetical protein [Gemmatimonadota bacterium]
MTLNDNELEVAARRLGTRAAARLDIERTSGAVLARLRATRATPWWAAPGLLQVAAMVVLALGIGVFYRGTTTGHLAALGSPVQLDPLSVDELEEVLDSLVIETPLSPDAPVGLADLDESQLTELLRRMEG